MGTTPTYALPYPEATDPADVPTDIRELADRIEAVVGPGSASGQIPIWDNATKKWVASSPPAVKPSSWTALTLPAYSFAIPGFAAPQAALWPDGIVNVQGLVNTTSAISQGMILATLPAGMRPTGKLRITTQLAVTGGSGPQQGNLEVGTDGTIKIDTVAQTGGTTVAAASLAFTFATL